VIYKKNITGGNKKTHSIREYNSTVVSGWW
jgi:hypothetical protein